MTPIPTRIWRKNSIRGTIMERQLRGLEDQETQDRKPLLRDVRSPVQRFGDALKLGQVQTGGIFAAGVCLFCLQASALRTQCRAGLPGVPPGPLAPIRLSYAP